MWFFPIAQSNLLITFNLRRQQGRVPDTFNSFYIFILIIRITKHNVFCDNATRLSIVCKLVIHIRCKYFNSIHLLRSIHSLKCSYVSTNGCIKIFNFFNNWKLIFNTIHFSTIKFIILLLFYNQFRKCIQ